MDFICYLNFAGREDLAKQTRHSCDEEKFSISNPAKKDFASQNKTTKEEDDGISSLDYEVIFAFSRIIFSISKLSLKVSTM